MDSFLLDQFDADHPIRQSGIHPVITDEWMNALNEYNAVIKFKRIWEATEGIAIGEHGKN